MSPCDYSNYPDDWERIRERVLLRANERCEECGVDNYAVGSRDTSGVFFDRNDIAEMGPDELFELFNTPEPKPIKIVLTVAHLDHNTHNNRMSNLRAWCQRCHLAYDLEHHVKNARATRERKRATA
jgi:hypothetical protein